MPDHMVKKSNRINLESAIVLENSSQGARGLNEAGKQVAKAALLLSITVVLSRLLGYGRDVALYTLFGQNYITDAYQAAFSIPDFLYMLLAGGALSTAFIPVFSSYIVAGRDDEAWESASVMFNYSLLILLFLIVLAYIYTGPLMNLLAPGIPNAYQDLAVVLTRIMFVQSLFMVLNGFAMGILNSYHHFAAPAWGSLVYNATIIVVGVFLVKPLGVAAFSIGVAVGAILNLVVQIPALRKVGLRYRFTLDYRNRGFRQILILMVPVLAGLGVGQLNLFVTQNLASGLGAGALSALRLAQRVANLPIGIFAISIAIAIFPTLSALKARGEIEPFKRAGSLGIRTVFLICLPASIGIIAIAEPLIRLLFQQGEFTSSMVTVTTQALIWYCVGTVAYAGTHVLSRSYYALQDTITPVAVAVLTIVCNIGFSLLLVEPMGHQGLALAYSLAGFINLALLLVVLRWKVGRMDGRRITANLAISLGASLLMYTAVKILLNAMLKVLPFTEKLNLTVGVGCSVLAGVIIYSGIVYFFKLEETELVLKMIRNRLHRSERPVT